MISVLQESYPSALPARLGERFAESTRLGWELSDFTNLFENQLVQFARGSASGLQHGGDGFPDFVAAAVAGAGNIATPFTGIARIPPEDSTTGPSPTQVDALNVAAPVEQHDGIALIQVQKSPAEPTTGSTGEESVDTLPASGRAIAVDGDAAQHQQNQSVVLALGPGGAEVYIRDAVLDADAGLAFARTAAELLQHHRLVLGRVLINGQRVHSEPGWPDATDSG